MTGRLEEAKNHLVSFAERAVHDRRVNTTWRIARWPTVAAGILLAGYAGYGVVEAVATPSPTALQKAARSGVLLRNYEDTYSAKLSFPTEGVVKVKGGKTDLSFDSALTEVGALCGVPTSISLWKADFTSTPNVGYITVNDDSCLRPLKAELAQAAANPIQ